MIIALDINAEYMVNRLWCISIGFRFVGSLANVQ